MPSITLLGTSGLVGSAVLEALKNPQFATKIEYPIKAVTSKDRSSESDDKIKYIQGQLDDEAFAKSFGTTDVVISALPGTKEVLDKCEVFLAQVKPRLYIPSEYGTENEKIRPELRIPMVGDKLSHVSNVRGLGIKTVCLYTSYFKWGALLNDFVGHLGIDVENKSATYLKDAGDRDNGNFEVQFSTGEDAINSIVALAVTDPKDMLDVYRVYSDSILLKDIVKEKEEAAGAKFTIVYKTKEELISEFKQLLAEGNPDFMKCLALGLALGPGNGLVFDANEKELINPGQSLWKWGSW